MSTTRYLHTSTLISQDNSVLITGGYAIGSGSVLASIERYIPSTGCFQSSGSMSSARAYHTADSMSALSSFIVIAGGYNGASVLDTADIYDPTTEGIVTISLLSAIYAHSSTIMSGSQLVLIGGVNSLGVVTNTGEVLIVSTPSVITSVINTVPVGIIWHTATLLQNTSDLALIVGGTDGVSYYSTVTLYQGSSNAFISLAPAVSLSTALAHHTATYLPSPINQVLIAGGYNGATVFNTLALFDVNTLQFVTITATMSTQRYSHTATLLPNGKILIIGGVDTITSKSSCELIDPFNSFVSTAVASLNIGRYYHRTTLISTSGNGTVLVCGGVNSVIGVLNSCEIYIV